MRHAAAGERDADKWPDDGLRPISPDGRRKQIEAARGMKRLGIVPDHILTSPLVRALQTAEILAEVLGGGQRIESVETLGTGCSSTAVVALLGRFPPEATIMLVGHEPAFSALAAALVGAGNAAFQLKKSGVIGIGFDGPARSGTGTLRYLLKPGQLRKCG